MAALAGQMALQNPKAAAGAGMMGMVMMFAVACLMLTPCSAIWSSICCCLYKCFGSDEDEPFIVGSQSKIED